MYFTCYKYGDDAESFGLKLLNLIQSHLSQVNILTEHIIKLNNY
jgi:hypothetical protein